MDLCNECSLLVFRQWSSICRVYKWMENWKLTCLLSLHKWIQHSRFELWHYKGLSEIITIFKKAQNTSFHINEHSNHASFIEVTKLWILIFVVHVIIIFPLSLGVFVTGLKIHAPYFFLPWQVLVHPKAITAKTNDNLRFLLTLW